MPTPISYTRLRTPLSYNMHLLDGITLTEHGTPTIRPYHGPLPDTMRGFNELMSRKPAARIHATNECAHFFLDDYQFERCWNRPELYPPILGECAMTLTPDYRLLNNNHARNSNEFARGYANAVSNVSGYATNSDRELVAEALADVRANGKNAKPMSRAINYVLNNRETALQRVLQLNKTSAKKYAKRSANKPAKNTTRKRT